MNLKSSKELLHDDPVSKSYKMLPIGNPLDPIETKTGHGWPNSCSGPRRRGVSHTIQALEQLKMVSLIIFWQDWMSRRNNLFLINLLRVEPAILLALPEGGRVLVFSLRHLSGKRRNAVKKTLNLHISKYKKVTKFPKGEIPPTQKKEDDPDCSAYKVLIATLYNYQ